MTQETELRCPMCGGPTEAATAEDVVAIHRRIQELQEQLRELEARLHPVQHPPVSGEATAESPIRRSPRPDNR
jgi:hypothetical protein